MKLEALKERRHGQVSLKRGRVLGVARFEPRWSNSSFTTRAPQRKKQNVPQSNGLREFDCFKSSARQLPLLELSC